MTDFGGKLRDARERRGVSLRDIAERTKISLPALEALERNDPSRLPGGIFARALVRSYAVEAGLDPEGTVREFVARFGLEGPVMAGDAVPPDEPDASLPARAGLAVGLVVASLVLAALILFLARGVKREEGGHRRLPADHSRTIEHHSAPPVPLRMQAAHGTRLPLSAD